MSNGKSLIDLGELSRPATVLIERVSDAIGGVFKPYQIKRVAKAEAEANIILANNEIQITELQGRAMARLVEEEGRKQENIENVVRGALPHLDENAAPQDIEQDWLAHFFEKSRIVSDVEMQTLWSKILAGEANKPHTYSRRTVEMVSAMDKSDAELFTTLCGFSFWSGDAIPMVYDVRHKIYVDNGLTFVGLTHLDSIALPHLDENAAPQDIEQDWLAHFFEKSRIVSDVEMQTLWSKILAGEANKPHTYSRRTVEMVSAMDKSDAELFTTLCGFSFWSGDAIPMVYDVRHKIYVDNGLTFVGLTHLDSIGLISFNTLSGFKLKRLPESFDLLYFGSKHQIKLQEKHNSEFNTGKVMLSKMGEQLAPICGAKPVKGYEEFVSEQWIELGYTVDGVTADD